MNYLVNEPNTRSLTFTFYICVLHFAVQISKQIKIEDI